MKKVLSLILVAAMLLSFAPVVSLQASAEGEIYVEYVELSGLPEEYTPGPATVPALQVVEGEVQITQVRWMLNEEQEATTLEANQVYYLAVTLTAKSGYCLEDWIKLQAERDYDLINWNDNRSQVFYYRYSQLEDVGLIKMQVNEPYEGMAVADLTCTVEGNAVLDRISVYDERTGQVLTEREFAPLRTYCITYYLRTKPGYEVGDNCSLEVNGGEKDVRFDGFDQELVAWFYFTTCVPIEVVELTMGEVTPGMALDAVELTVDPDAPYELYNYNVCAYDDEVDVLEAGRNYEVSYYLAAKEGYVFAEEVRGTINGEETSCWSSGSGLEANGQMEIGFGVDYVSLRGLPYEIEPGQAEQLELWCNDQVKITDIAWVDAAKQPVTAFQDGNIYYLAVSLEPAGIRSFAQEPQVELDDPLETTFVKQGDKKAVVYIRYSLEPALEQVAVTVSGVQIGAPLDSVTVTVDGNASFAEARIQEVIPTSENSYYTLEPESNVFEAGKIYRIECYLNPGAGYRFSYETVFIVNGERFGEVGLYGQQAMLGVAVDTCQKIDTAKLTMDEVKVGKAFSDLQPKVPAGANYTAVAYWYDDTDGWEEATGKVQSGHRYEAQIVLQAKDGYVFAQDATATFNGAAFDIYCSDYRNFAWGWTEKSFMTPITKVELPAMPTSIQKNKTLPVATVSGKNYTLRVNWATVDGEEKTVADVDGIYLLVYSAEVKDGYEFTDDTKFYIGGKEARPIERGWRDGQFIQSYSIGIPTVDRVDLICQELTVGQEPPEVTVSDDAAYSLWDVSWWQSATRDWYSFDEPAQVLQNGLYTYASGMIYVAEGMALDANAAFYIGGEKMTPAAFYNFGQYAIVLFELGKLGEVEKLTAPTVTVAGKTISWNAVLNATGYEVYRATSKSGKYTRVATVETTAFTDDVAAGKTYYYKVKAVYSPDTSKNSGNSAVVSVVCKCDAPVIQVTRADSGKPVVSWETVSGAKQYTVYRATSETGKYTKLGTTKSLRYTDSKAAVGTTYYYKVIANASSSKYNSGYSNVVSRYAVCGTPTVTVKVAAASGKPVLSWDKITGAYGYEVYLLGAEDYVTLGMVTGTSFTDESCGAGEGRYYGVRAIGSCEEYDSDVSQPVLGKGTCAQPKLQGSIDSLGLPVLSWQPVEGAQSYGVYRSTKATKGYTLVQTVETLSYTDATVAPGKTYYYQVVALGENCQSAASANVKLTGKCAAPVITVVNGSTGKPVVSWEKITGAKQYTVYRATSEAGKYTKLGTTKSLSYTDSKAKAGTEYFYKVIANASSSKCNSIYSNICMCYVICGTPTVTVKVDTATGKPGLSWGKVEGAVAYVIYRQLPGETEFTEITRQTGTAFLDQTAPIDTLCSYKVQALGANDMLHGAQTQTLTAASGIAQPKLQGSVDATTGLPVLSWQPVEGAQSYQIYRSTKSTKGYTLVQTVETPSYTDITVAPGKTYYYQVVAVGENSTSAQSANVKLTGKCAVTELFVENAENGKPYLQWYKVTGAKKYTVYRATSETGKYTKLGTTTKIEYIDTKAAAGTTYYYKVIANASSSKYNSGYSNTVSCGVTCAAPAVKVTNNAAGKPVVSWSKVAGAVGYKIEYQFGYLGGGRPSVYDVYITGTSYTFDELTVDMFGYVWVTAIAADEAYNSQPAEVEAEVIPATPKLTGKVGTAGKPVITWVDNGDAVIYEIYRSTKSGSGYVLIDEVQDMGEGEDQAFVPVYEDTTAVKGKTYYYKIVARSWNSKSQLSGYVKVKSK